MLSTNEIETIYPDLKNVYCWSSSITGANSLEIEIQQHQNGPKCVTPHSIVALIEELQRMNSKPTE
jgi:hypothetical protein